VDMKSDRPLVRSKCPKCGYTLTTNEQPSDWKCPVDGETLGAVPYP
jgi:rubrerythrin